VVPEGRLSSEQLAVAVSEATSEWIAIGAAVPEFSASVGALPDALLGATSGSSIVIDDDAAGWGWNRMHLTTVVRHEIGHVLGLGHAPSGIMNETLMPAETRSVNAEDFPPLPSDMSASDPVGGESVVAPDPVVGGETPRASDEAGSAVDSGPASTSAAEAPALVTAGVGAIETYLAALRQHESGNNYTALSRISTASGAYQYIDSTWANFAGFARAYLAPPAVQDARARSDALRAFAMYGNWEQVAAAHFYPKWAGDRSLWHMVPAPGNPTVQAYVDRVLRLMGLPSSEPLRPSDTAAGPTNTTSAAAVAAVTEITAPDVTEASGTASASEVTVGGPPGSRETARTAGESDSDAPTLESPATLRASTRTDADATVLNTSAGGRDRESGHHGGIDTRVLAITPADRARMHHSCGHARSPRRAA